MKITKLQPPISRMFLFMLALVLWNCSSSADLILPANEDVSMKLKSGKITSEEYVCNPQSAPLLTKKKQPIGIVNLVTDMYGDILVSVSTKNGWTIQNIEFYAGAIDEIPLDSDGNPSPESFSQTISFPQGESNCSTAIAPTGYYTVGDLYYCAVAIHADVTKINKNGRTIQSEEVWIAGQEIKPEISWATFYPYERIPCGTPQP